MSTVLLPTKILPAFCIFDQQSNNSLLLPFISHFERLGVVSRRLVVTRGPSRLSLSGSYLGFLSRIWLQRQSRRLQAFVLRLLTRIPSRLSRRKKNKNILCVCCRGFEPRVPVDWDVYYFQFFTTGAAWVVFVVKQLQWHLARVGVDATLQQWFMDAFILWALPVVPRSPMHAFARVNTPLCVKCLTRFLSSFLWLRSDLSIPV